MSYCRWSSDNFQCDIYCYEHCYGGIMIHVAANRIAEPLPEMPAFTRENLESGVWMDAHRRNMALLDKMERVAIGLPHDGETFHVESFQEAADKLIELRKVGYQVPDHAIETLMEESEVEQEAGGDD